VCTHEIDEVGYVQLDARGAELLFQVSPRGRKSSVGLASNLPFSEWGGIIADARLVAAVIDWVTSRRLLERRVRGHTAAEISAHPSTNSS
jgi:DNA replication protein DnaC